jgi:hypothetical protein
MTVTQEVAGSSPVDSAKGGGRPDKSGSPVDSAKGGGCPDLSGSIPQENYKNNPESKDIRAFFCPYERGSSLGSSITNRTQLWRDFSESFSTSFLFPPFTKGGIGGSL